MKNAKKNNIVFERVQEYMYIMQLSETLLRYLSAEGNGNADQIKQIKEIRNTAFAGMLRENLEGVVMKDEEKDGNKLQLTINNVNYYCNLLDLYHVLKDDYQTVTGLDPNILPHEENVDKSKIEKNSDLKNNDIASINKTEVEVTKSYFNKKYSNEKNINNMVYIEAEISVKTESCITSQNVYFAPLCMYQNNPKAEFAAVNLDEKSEQTYVSDNAGEIHMKIDECDVTFMSSFIDGEFNVFITSGSDLLKGVEVTKTENKYMPASDANVDFGCLCYKYNDSEIRVFPMSNQNNRSGNAETSVIVKTNDKYTIFHRLGRDKFEITIDNETRQIINYWRGKVLVSEIL